MFCNCSTLGIFGKIQTYHTNNQPIELQTFLSNAKKPVTCCNKNSSKCPCSVVHGVSISYMNKTILVSVFQKFSL